LILIAATLLLLAGCTKADRGSQEETSPLDESYHAGGIDSDEEEWNSAIAKYTEIIQLDPNDAEAYYNRGNAYSDKGDYDRAIADFTQAVRVDSNYTSAYYGRGLAYSGKGDYDRAIADYTQVIRLNPDHVDAYNNRASSTIVAKRTVSGQSPITTRRYDLTGRCGCNPHKPPTPPRRPLTSRNL
jgi:tetratricopeptide (TPR) repeat protein